MTYLCVLSTEALFLTPIWGTQNHLSFLTDVCCFWQPIKMLLPFIFLGPPYLISIIFRQMSILHYIWHKPISQPSAEYWARGKGKSLPKVTSVLGYFPKGISSSDLAVLGKANIYHKPRKTGFGKFVKFLDLISAKYIRTAHFLFLRSNPTFDPQKE